MTEEKLGKLLKQIRSMEIQISDIEACEKTQFNQFYSSLQISDQLISKFRQIVQNHFQNQFYFNSSGKIKFSIYKEENGTRKIFHRMVFALSNTLKQDIALKFCLTSQQERLDFVNVLGYKIYGKPQFLQIQQSATEFMNSLIQNP